MNDKYRKIFFDLLTGLMLLSLLLIGCQQSTSDQQLTSNQPDYGDVAIEYWHDDLRNISCWILFADHNRGGISCIPDWQLDKP